VDFISELWTTAEGIAQVYASGYWDARVPGEVRSPIRIRGSKVLESDASRSRQRSTTPSQVRSVFCSEIGYSNHRLPFSAAGAIIVRIAYGYEAQEQGDPLITIAETTLNNFSRFTEPGAYLVDFLPLCKSPFYVLGSVAGISVTYLPSEIRSSVVSWDGFQEGSFRSKEDPQPFRRDAIPICYA
jgi:hypothetical protein